MQLFPPILWTALSLMTVSLFKHQCLVLMKPSMSGLLASHPRNHCRPHILKLSSMFSKSSVILALKFVVHFCSFLLFLSSLVLWWLYLVLCWIPYLSGARVRHSAHGKGHEEGGSTYTKAGSSLRSPPGNPRASTPITRACLLYYFVLPPTPLTLRGAVPHHLFRRRS